MSINYLLGKITHRSNSIKYFHHFKEKVHTENGFNCNEKNVRNKWKTNFAVLYNVPER